MPLRIVTDSTADLPPDIVEQCGITVVPLSVLFGDEELRDGIDITSEQFFRRLQRESRLPTTSQPSAGSFRRAYESLIAQGATEILSIHISGKLSGTLESARQGAEGLSSARIVHIDSGMASLALGLAAIAAATAAGEGAGLDEVQRHVEAQVRRTHLLFVVDTLEYLRRGGRVGRASEFVGSLLQVKPILSLEGGEVVPVARVRTRRKAIEEMIDRVAALRPLEQAAAIHAAAPHDLEYVATRVQGYAPGVSVITGALGPVVGVHAGPGLVGVAVVSASTANGSPPSLGP